MQERLGLEQQTYPQGYISSRLLLSHKRLMSNLSLNRGFKGPEIRQELTKQRIEAVTDWQQQQII